MIEAQSDVIVLNDSLTGSLVIRNAGQNSVFKVVSNEAKLLEVKPNYGIIRNHEEVGSIMINIRYKGTITELRELKLKVCWIPTTQESIRHFELAEKYEKIKQKEKNRQKQLLFSFHFSENKVNREFRYKRPFEQHEKVQKIEIQNRKSNLIQIEKKQQEGKAAIQEEAFQPAPDNSSGNKNIWSYVAISLFVGFFVGIKIAPQPFKDSL